MLTYAEEYIKKKKTNYLVGVLLIKCFKKKLFTTAQLRIVFHYHGRVTRYVILGFFSFERLQGKMSSANFVLFT